MGDRIYGNSAPVINRSPHATVSMQGSIGEAEFQNALREIEAHVSRLGDELSHQLVKRMIDESRSKEARLEPGRLRRLWDTLVDVLPQAASVAQAMKTVAAVLTV